MLGLTSLGAVHTAISLVAVAAGIVSFVRFKEIAAGTALGKIYIWTVNEPEVHILGDTAWITYVNHGSIKDASGTKEATWLESAFLEKEKGIWRIHFFHSTRVPEKK